MAFLMRTGRAEKSVDDEGKEVIRDPDVLHRRRGERLHCVAAGNGRASHQASWACEWWV
jgi:hypothetical protein